MDKTPQTSTQPEAKFKSGAVVASVWKNEGQNGPYRTVTLTRSYKDKDDNWQRTKTLRPKDMDDVIIVAGQVTEKMAELEPAAPETATDAVHETPPPKTKKASRPRKAKQAA